MRLVVCWMLLSGICFGQVPVELEEFAKKAIVGVQWIPHLPANEDFKSSVLVRNDDVDDAVRFLVVFLLPSGPNALVTYVDENGVQGQSDTWEVSVPSQGSALAYITAIDGARSVHAIVFSLREPAADIIGTDNVGIEASYARVANGQVLATVGHGSVKPTRGFKMNLDYTTSPFSFENKLRGLAIVNTDLDVSCDCRTFLVTRSGIPVASDTLTIPAREKWLGLAADLFPGANTLLQHGQGSIFLACEKEISVLGLTFQGNALGSAPIFRFN